MNKSFVRVNGGRLPSEVNDQITKFRWRVREESGISAR